MSAEDVKAHSKFLDSVRCTGCGRRAEVIDHGETDDDPVDIGDSPRAVAERWIGEEAGDYWSVACSCSWCWDDCGGRPTVRHALTVLHRHEVTIGKGLAALIVAKLDGSIK